MQVSLPRNVICTAVALCLVAAGCTGSGAQERAANGRDTTTSSSSTTTTVEPTTTSTTTTSLATSTTPPPPPPGLGRESRGAEVQALEQKLTELKYDTGKVDGVFDAATGHAVMAFQKANGLPRSSRATDDVLAALATASEPAAMLPAGGADRVEIDLKRQILLLYKGGSLLRVLSVSTGNNKRYCVDGQCATAVTPGGSFKVNRKIRGLRVSRLGKLFNPLYFNGGIAIHGSPSVPAGPASHGCVRIPMHASLWFFDTVPSGTPVYVIGGAKAPVPFNEQAPPDDGSSATTAPTTSSTSSTSSTSTSTTLFVPAETTTSTTSSTTSTTSPGFTG
ncbi:MAG: L,D-transpeptidase family protein [Actinobacteria bacterium]|nr:L,D-transpeptidase family protein [Actinomycetota bacterium]